MREHQAGSWASNALLLVLAVAVALVIWNLAAENRELKARLEGLAAPSPESMLAAGDAVPGVELVGADGGRAHLDELVAEGGVIVFLTTTCPFCEQTMPLWSELFASYAERGVPFVGVSFDAPAATAAYAEAKAVDWPLWTLADPARVAGLSVPRVPFTVLVAPGARVDRAWLGVLAEQDIEALRGALQGRLAAAGSTTE